MIRALAVFLLVANVLVAAWFHWHVTPEAPSSPPPLAAGPLILLGELPQRHAAEPPRPAVAEAVVELARVDDEGCQALGPFVDRDDVIAVRDRLVEAGVVAWPRAVDASRRLGYWVHTPASPSREDAAAVVERLRRAGVRDYYVVVDGDVQNAVSLGVFSAVEAAEQHASRLRALGFEVEVGERRRQLTAWWLDFPVPESGSTAAAAVIDLVLAGEGLVLQPRACE